jgi:hypothetical protein
VLVAGLGNSCVKIFLLSVGIDDAATVVRLTEFEVPTELLYAFRLVLTIIFEEGRAWQLGIVFAIIWTGVFPLSL